MPQKGFPLLSLREKWRIIIPALGINDTTANVLTEYRFGLFAIKWLSYKQNELKWLKFTLLMQLSRQKNGLSTLPLLFVLAFVALLIFALMSHFFLHLNPLDLHFHDTYFVIAQSKVIVFVSLFFGLFASIYYLFPILFRRNMNPVLGYIHFIITFIGVLAIFLPVHYQGFVGRPRRYYDYSAWESFKQISGLNHFITIIVIAMFFAQVTFALNFLISIFIGKRIDQQPRK